MTASILAIQTLLILMEQPAFHVLYLPISTSKHSLAKIAHRNNDLILKTDYANMPIQNSFQIQTTKTSTIMATTKPLQTP